MTFEQCWTTPHTASFDPATTVNAAPGAVPGTFNHPETLYQAQVDGNLCEITGSIMFQNFAEDAYIDAEALGVLDPANNNLRDPASPPVQLVVREAPVMKGGLDMARVSMLDPRAANDALQLLPGALPAPDDGFFTPATYVGAFDGCTNWLAGWSAADQFGMLVTTPLCP